MCLESIELVSSPYSAIGYAVMKRFTKNDIYISIYSSDSEKVYNVGEEYEAQYILGRRTFLGYRDSFGFHGFKTIEEARKYKHEVGLTGSVIVMCRFKDIFVEGKVYVGRHSITKARQFIDSFRAKKKTIVEEVY